jgi:hypothetical protein
MKTPFRVLAMIGMLGAGPLLGCDDHSSGPLDNAGGAAGSPTEHATGNATYRVPVEAELAPFATYPLDRVRFEVEEDQVRIRYAFPRWLSGVSAGVVLEGNYAEDVTSFDVTAGDLGSGSCTRTGASFECHEDLPGLDVDREGAAERMLDAELPSAEVEQRLRVTDVFSTDPIGILAFDLL